MRRIVFCGAVAASSGLGIAIALIADLLSPAVVAGSALSVGIATVMALRYYSCRDLLDPFFLVSFSLLWYFGMHLLWLEQQTVDNTGIHVPFRHGLAAGAAWIALAYVAFAIGYFNRSLPVGRQLVVRREQVGRFVSATPGALISVYALGMSAALYGLATGAYSKGTAYSGGSNVQTIRAVAALALVAFIYAVVQSNRGGGGARLAIGFGLGLALFGIASSHKQIIFEVIFAWLAARHFGGRRLRLGPVIAVAMLFLFVVTPVLQGNRTSATYREASATAQAESGILDWPGRLVQLASDPDSMLAGWDIVNRRTNGAESMALAVLYAGHSAPFLLGSEWPAIPATAIPGEVWPGKPTSDSGYFSRVYAGQVDDGFSGLTVARTVPGDLWLNFGPPGLLLGIAGLGIVLRSLRSFVLFGDPGIAVPLFVLVMLEILLIEVSVPTLASEVLIRTASVLFGVWLIRGLTRARSNLLSRRPSPIPTS